MAIYAREIDRKGNKYEEHLLTTKMLPLCPFDAATTSKGTIIAYRNNQNNLTIQRYENKIWTASKVVKKDKWKTTATIEVPAIATLDDQVALAWLTKSNGQSIFQLALSKDSGTQFKMLLSQQKAPLIGKIDLVWSNSNQLCLTWLEQKDQHISLILTYMDLSGNILQQEQLITLPLSATQNAPILIKNEEEILIAWKPTAQTETLIFEKKKEPIEKFLLVNE